MRKIVFHLNCLEQGGAERVVTTLADWFVNNGDEIFIATEWKAQNEFVIDDRIRRIHVGLTQKQETASRWAQFFYRIKNLRTFLKKEKPDIVIAFAKKANYRALMATVFMKVPVIISVRTNPMKHFSGKKDRLLVSLLFPRAAGNVFQTEGAKSFFSPRIQKKSRIILNPIHEKYIQSKKTTQRRKVVVQSGRLAVPKNQLMLIEAFVQVHEKHPDYRLEIYGGDSGDGTKEQLEQSIERNHAGNYVFLMGSSDQLEKEMADAALFAFSSDWEGLPNALMEAMALGLPIVATDCPCGGPATLIRDGENGLLVPIKDADAMAAGILRLIEDRELAERLGDNARRIGEGANTEAICRQWKEYIEELCVKAR
ncbi:MAG: glycosyltransferase family 4 protein [Lachnospiraceae bacterium]|nr:glycosyltransferase family 4 protein [Lachnospiraceae bacterium]